MTSGSKNPKKTAVKPQIPQSVIDNWLKNHPSVDSTNFSFDKLKDLKITASTNLNKSVKVTSKPTNSNFKSTIDNLKNNPQHFSGTTVKSSNNTFFNTTELVKKRNTEFPTLSGTPQPHRVKSIPISGVTKQTPEPTSKKLVKTGLSLPVASTVFTAGTVDYSFPYGENYGFTSTIYDIQIQSDGKILVAGETYQDYYYDGESWPMQGLIRLNPDGTVDETFDIRYNWDYYGGGFNGIVYSIAIQSDGKILCGGSFTDFDRDNQLYTTNYIVRLNSDGSLDNTFNTGNGFDSDVYSIVIQSDGKILCGGYFTSYNGNNANYIIRLNTNGGIDSSFVYGDNAVSFNDYVNKIVVQPDGKVLVGGYFTYYANIAQNYITRLNSDGTLDTTFQIGIGFNNEVNTIALQSTGKIIVGGYFTYFNNNDLYGGNIVRLSSDGTLDTRFAYGLNDAVFSILVQSNDKIVVGGDFGTYYPEYNDTWSIDELVRFNSDCSFDYSFYYEELFNSTVNAIAIQEDGKLLVGGDFNNNGDATTFPLNYFGRLNNSITAYQYIYLAITDFCTNGVGTVMTVGSNTNPVYSIYGPANVYSFNSVTNPSQTKIGIAIPGSEFSGYPTNIIELTQKNDYGLVESGGCYDAIRDNAFVAVCYDVFDGVPGTYQILVDRKYELNDIGFYHFEYFDGVNILFHSTFQIVDLFEYDSDDIVPSEILPYIPYESAEESVQANGQYVFIVDFNEECGTMTLVKDYNACLDYNYISFKNCSVCSQINYIYSYYTDTLANIITGGTPVINSAKIWDSNVDCMKNSAYYGYPNPTFDGGYNKFNEPIYKMLQQPDGKILVGGDFTDFDGNPANYIIRLNTDGTIDKDFNYINDIYGGGFNNTVWALALQPDGKILVGGTFTEYNGDYAGRIIRLNPDGSIDNSFTYSDEFNNDVYAIAVQNDGKIVVGGTFNYYFDYECNGYIRLNPDGTPDTTFKQYPVEGYIYSILLEDVGGVEYYSGIKNTKQNIILGGDFGMYIPELDFEPLCIVKLDFEGTFINTFGDGMTGYNGGIYDMKKQSDGKLICGGSFWEYQNEYCPWNIIRLNIDGSQDFSFVGGISNDGGGFNDGDVYSLEILPNDKIMVGGAFIIFADLNGFNYVPFLVRLTSDGLLDKTFTYDLDDNYVNNLILLSDKTLMVGGDFSIPYGYYIFNLFIGEDYMLHSFNTCDGKTTNIYQPSTFSSGYDTVNVSNYNLSLMQFVNDEYPVDDDYSICIFPTDFSVDFLGNNYTSVNVSSNSYITFGDPELNGGAAAYGFAIPNEIESDGAGQPGVYISTSCPSDLLNGLDDEAFFVYSGLSNDGNSMIIRYLGGYHCNYQYPNKLDLIYNFVFYKNNSTYFDFYIDKNTVFYKNDPTGGTSDGSNSFIGTFDSSSNKSYRIFSDATVTPLIKPIKANINTSPVVCGLVGDIIITPQNTAGLYKNSGSMYFDGTDNTTVTVDYNINMDLDFDSWTIEWFQYFTSDIECCLRVFDIGSFPGEEVGASIESNSIVIWLKSGSTFVNLIAPVKNTWTHFAITSENVGGNTRVIRVFQNGKLLDYFTFTDDLNNFNEGGNLPLTIGGMGDGTSTFQGYITNFRWTKGYCYYIEDFTVPTQPLPTWDSQLLMLATNASELLTDSTDTQSITANNVTWSELNPFGYPEYFISTDDTNYDDCATCTATTKYNAILLVRDGIRPPFVNYVSITKENIERIKTYGPISVDSMAGIHGLNTYELLNYYL